MGTMRWSGTVIVLGVAVRLRMTGAVVSAIVMAKVFVAVFPKASVAVAVTVVTPSGNMVPDAGLKVTGTLPLTASCADPAKVTLAPTGPVASATRLPGAVRTGGVVSTTFTAN